MAFRVVGGRRFEEFFDKYGVLDSQPPPRQSGVPLAAARAAVRGESDIFTMKSLILAQDER